MSTTATPAPPAKPRRRWRRRLLWCAAIVVGLRLLLPFAIPRVLDAVLAGVGLHAEYDALSLSLLGGECELRNLVITAAEAEGAAPPMLRVGRVYVDLDTLALIGGEVVLRRVEVVSAHANLARDDDGNIAGFTSGATTSPTATTPPATATPATAVAPAPISFSLPLRVLSLRVHDLRVHLEDAALPAPHTIDAEADLTVQDLGDPLQPADLLLHLQIPQCLDALRLEGSLLAHERQLAGELHLDLRGLQPAPIAPWLAAIGLAPAAPNITAEVNVHVQAEPHAADALATALRADVDARVFDRDLLQAELRHVSLVVDHLTHAGIGHAQVAVEGAFLAAQRDEAGQVQALGFRFVPATTAAAAPPAAPPAPPEPGAPFAISADLSDVNLVWRDAVPGMPPELDLELAEAACSKLTIPPGVEPVSFHATLRLPGVVDELQLRDGKLQHAGGGMSVSGALLGNGITLQRLQPLLDAAGIESTFARGELQASIVAHSQQTPGGMRADVELGPVRLRDGESGIVFGGVHVRGLLLGADGAVHADAVECEGPVVAVKLRSDGTLELPGLLLRPAPEEAAGPVAVEASAAKGTAKARIDVEHFAWSGAQVSFTDESVEPPVQLAISAALTADHFVLAGAHADDPPGIISLTLAAPGVATATVRGQVQTGPDRARAEVLVEANGLTLAAMRPWLLAAGLESTLDDGALLAHVTAMAALPPSPAGLEVDVTNLSLRSGGAELLSLGRAHVTGLVAGAERTDIEAIEVDRPLLTLARGTDGVLQAAGLRFLPPANPSAPAPAEAPADAAPAARLSIGEVKVTQGAAAWSDDAVAAPVSCRADFALQVRQLTAGPGALPTPLQLTLQLGDTVDKLEVKGDVQLDADNFACRLGIEGHGLRGGSLAGYLPPGLQMTLAGGELLARLDAESSPAPGGGVALKLQLEDLSLRDGGTTLLELAELSLVVPRLHPAARAMHLSSCRLGGLRTTVTTLADGVELAGLRMTPPAPPVAATAAAPPANRAPAAPVRAPAQLPDLRLDGLDLQVAGLRVVDGTRPSAEPLEVSLHLCTTAPWHSDVEDQAQPPPLLLRLTAAAQPLLRGLALDLKLQPQLMEPQLEGALSVTGIDTTALLRVRPALANLFEGGDVSDGTFGLRFFAELDLSRRNRDEFPVGMPFALRAEVRDVALRRTPDGPLLAGIESIACDVPMFDPRTGDVRAHLIEVNTPSFHLVRQADGLHALGLVLRQDPAPAEAPAPIDEAPQQERTPPTFAAAEIHASGIDVRYTNLNTTPPTELPIDDLDLVISRFSTAALREPLPFQFTLNLGGADIALPVLRRNSSVFTGLLSSAASVVSGPDKEEMAQQPWVDEFRADGQLQLFPAPQGKVRLSLGSFDLRCLDRLAEGAGADISDGMLDAGVTIELRGEKGIAVQSQLTFTHLSMSEPAGGPISTYLKLPVSLDTMLYLLRNDQDEQRVPLSFELSKGEISGGAVAAEAVSALGAVLADAIAKSPLRVASVFTGLLGIGGGSEDLNKLAASVPFVTGDAGLPADLETQLQSLVAFAAGDANITLVLRHDLGGADLERVQLLANPPVADAKAMAARLRQELAVSNKERTALAATVEAQISAGRHEEVAQSRARLQNLDRAFGTTATALDATLQLLRDDRDQRADARTRAAANDLATARLQAMQSWLAGKLGAGGDARVEQRTPRFTRVATAAGSAGGTVTVVPVRRQRS